MCESSLQGAADMPVCQYERNFDLHNGHAPISSIIMENDPDPTLYQHRKLLLVAIALTALYTQLAIVMSLPAKPPRKREAQWSDQEMTQLIQYLHEHRSEGGDGGTAPRIPAYTRCFRGSQDCKASEEQVGRCGYPKTTLTILLLILISQLKAIFRAIITYRDTTSGTHWDNTVGANIDGPAAEAAWNNYISTSNISTIQHLTPSPYLLYDTGHQVDCPFQ
jgi:hypothetical protein